MDTDTSGSSSVSLSQSAEQIIGLVSELNTRENSTNDQSVQQIKTETKYFHINFVCPICADEDNTQFCSPPLG